MGICLGAAGQHTGALAGDRSPTMGETHPADVVLARRVLMTGIGRNMDEITGMIEDGGAFSLNEAREHADLISTMLLAGMSKSPFGGFLPPFQPFSGPVALICVATAALIGVSSALVPALSASRISIVAALRSTD